MMEEDSKGFSDILYCDKYGCHNSHVAYSVGTVQLHKKVDYVTYEKLRTIQKKKLASCHFHIAIGPCREVFDFEFVLCMYLEFGLTRC